MLFHCASSSLVYSLVPSSSCTPSSSPSAPTSMLLSFAFLPFCGFGSKFFSDCTSRWFFTCVLTKSIFCWYVTKVVCSNNFSLMLTGTISSSAIIFAGSSILNPLSWPITSHRSSARCSSVMSFTLSGLMKARNFPILSCVLLPPNSSYSNRQSSSPRCAPARFLVPLIPSVSNLDTSAYSMPLTRDTS